ncbi:Splicing factor-like protein, partial [Parasponia andersonii]
LLHQEKNNVTNGFEIADSDIQSKKIFVGGLPHDLNTGEFKAYFDNYSSVVDIVIMHDKQTLKGRGFGFVTFQSKETVNNALGKSFHTLKDKFVEVKRAKPKGTSVQNNNNDGIFFPNFACTVITMGFPL